MGTPRRKKPRKQGPPPKGWSGAKPKPPIELRPDEIIPPDPPVASKIEDVVEKVEAVAGRTATDGTYQSASIVTLAIIIAVVVVGGLLWLGLSLRVT